jgi:hypothetical protein
MNESYFKYCELIQKSVNKEIRLQLIYCDGMKISRERVFMIRVNTEINDYFSYQFSDIDIVKCRSVWRHIMKCYTDKHNNVFREVLDKHYH